MKKTMTRICSMLLVLVLIAGLLPVMTVFASATSLKEKQDAIVQTAFAYYDKGAPVQYDSIELSVVSKGKGGARRITMECAPEFATKDSTWFSVCSDYPYQIYYNVFGYKLCGDPVRNWTGRLSKYNPDKDPICVYKYDSKKDKRPLKEVLAEYCSKLEPGDVINGVSAEGQGGHVMFFIGDVDGDGVGDLIHCSGYKYNTRTGEDRPETTTGAIPEIPGKINPCYGPTRNYSGISLHPCEEYLNQRYAGRGGENGGGIVLSIIRPLNEITDEKYPMSDSAKTRLQFPRLVYNRTANKSRYTDVEEGGTLTLSVELKNLSKKSYTVPVAEVVPDNVTFVKASDGAKVDGKNISWNVSLNAGETKTVSYDCTVNAKRLEEVVFTGGSAGKIPSNTVTVTVGGKHLTDAENAVLADIRAHKDQYRNVLKTDFASTIYQKILKLNVKLPSMQDAFKNMFKKIEFGGKSVFVVRDDLQGEWKTYKDMMVPEFIGGFYYGMMDTTHRVLDLKCDFLQPGDLVYEISSTAKPDKGEVMVYLGNSQFLRQVRSDGGAAVLDFFELQKAHTYNIFFALRPTLAYDDVHALS